MSGDGYAGGSPHVHLVCSEGYVVVGGAGTVQTLSGDGFREYPLEEGTVLWFQPGVIHRLTTKESLELVVVMQNSGLPEAGDAVLTFPPANLVNRGAYERAANIIENGSQSLELARRRRDKAVTGFTQLSAEVRAGRLESLNDFLDQAGALVAPRAAIWSTMIAEGPQRDVEDSLSRLRALAAGEYSHLLRSRVDVLENPPAQTLGMCGFLAAYDPMRSA
jgi:hypothetical protein